MGGVGPAVALPSAACNARTPLSLGWEAFTPTISPAPQSDLHGSVTFYGAVGSSLQAIFALSTAADEAFPLGKPHGQLSHGLFTRRARERCSEKHHRAAPCMGTWGQHWGQAVQVMAWREQSVQAAHVHRWLCARVLGWLCACVQLSVRLPCFTTEASPACSRR